MANSTVLQEQYSVAARFEGGYRPVLEISLESARSRDLVDAVVIMMNPGSSMPKPGFESETGMVPTQPDQTQYQIMRLMERCRWSRVRVLNLSDIRNANSSNFRELMKTHGDLSHSIFSPSRAAELQEALKRKIDAPLIAAWGCHSDLGSLATLALNAMEGSTVLGRPGAGGEWRYWHPLLRNTKFQRQWVDEIVSGVQKRSFSL